MIIVYALAYHSRISLLTGSTRYGVVIGFKKIRPSIGIYLRRRSKSVSAIRSSHRLYFGNDF